MVDFLIIRLILPGLGRFSGEVSIEEAEELADFLLCFLGIVWLSGVWNEGFESVVLVHDLRESSVLAGDTGAEFVSSL